MLCVPQNFVFHSPNITKHSRNNSNANSIWYLQWLCIALSFRTLVANGGCQIIYLFWHILCVSLNVKHFFPSHLIWFAVEQKKKKKKTAQTFKRRTACRLSPMRLSELFHSLWYSSFTLFEQIVPSNHTIFFEINIKRNHPRPTDIV